MCNSSILASLFECNGSCYFLKLLNMQIGSRGKVPPWTPLLSNGLGILSVPKGYLFRAGKSKELISSLISSKSYRFLGVRLEVHMGTYFCNEFFQYNSSPCVCALLPLSPFALALVKGHLQVEMSLNWQSFQSHILGG